MDNSIAFYHSDELQNPLQVQIENGSFCLTHLQPTELFINTKHNCVYATLIYLAKKN